MQAHTSPPFEMEVTGGMSFLKMHKKTEPDGLLPSLFKDDVNIGVNRTSGINPGKGTDSQGLV